MTVAAASSGPLAVEVHDLHKVFHGSGGGLRGLTMQVPRGGIHGFLGRNGAGKTTTMKCLMGLLRRDAGSFVVLGEPYDPISDARLRAHLGFAPELANLPEYLTGAEAIETYGRLRGLTLAEVHRERSFLVDRLDLTEFAANKLKTYSKGTRARLAVAIAMVGDPEILVLDEPTSGLDPVALAHFRDLLKELIDGPGGPRSILLSSHQLGEVERLCSSLTIIDRGRTLVEGPTPELLRKIAGGDMYRAEFRRLSDTLATSITALPGVSEVARVEGVPGGLRLRVTNGADPREPLAQLAVAHGGLLLSCERELVSVEDLFLAFVEGRPIASPDPAKMWAVPAAPPPTPGPAEGPAPAPSPRPDRPATGGGPGSMAPSPSDGPPTPSSLRGPNAAEPLPSLSGDRGTARDPVAASARAKEPAAGDGVTKEEPPLAGAPPASPTASPSPYPVAPSPALDTPRDSVGGGPGPTDPPRPTGSVRCPGCGAENEIRARSCTACGAPFPPSAAAGGSDAEARAAVGGTAAAAPTSPEPLPGPSVASAPPGGQSASRRPCPYCGIWNDMDFDFCQRCGKRLPRLPGTG